MPTNLYEISGKSAGDEISSTGEGRHITVAESLLSHPYHSDGFVDVGDPVRVGEFVGRAFDSAAAATDMIPFDSEGIFAFNVLGDVNGVATELTFGMPVFIQKTPGTDVYLLTGENPEATHQPFGHVMATVTASLTVPTLVAVKIHLDPAQANVDLTQIVVSKGGNDLGDGTWDRPLLSIQAGLDLATATRNEIFVGPGTYDEALTWPLISGLHLVGMERNFSVVLSAPIAADQVIDISPGVQTSTFEVYLENLYIDHGAVAGQDGILIDNADMTKKCNVYIRDCGGDADSDSDSFLTTSHADASNAIRIYWEGNNGGVEGRIYLDVGNNGDRFYATGVVFNGGFVTSADAIVTDFRFIQCTIKHEGITGGNAAQEVYSVISYSQTGATFAKIDTADLAGSHGENIVD